MWQGTPEQFWERVRSGPAAGERPSVAAPGMVSEPDRPAPAVGPSQPDGDREPVGRQASVVGRAQPEPDEPSASELVKQLTEQTKTLVKQEMRLAQVELQEKGKKVGMGAGMFGAGGLVAFIGATALITALVLAISTALAPWLSALIVGVVLLAIAGGAALLGKKQIEQATPPIPEQTAETVKEDVQHVKEKARR